jgi:hypothetical protein
MTTVDPGKTRRPPAEKASKPSGKAQTFGDRITDDQIKRWIWRVAVAVVAAIIFSIAFNVEVGITIAVIGMIVDVIRRSRLDSAVEAWQGRAVAQRKTERQLRALRKNGYVTLHARVVPRDEQGASDGQIDHVVVGPTGVYAIDSEKWDRRLPVRVLSHRKLFHGPFNKKERLDEARWEADQASKEISEELGFEVPVQPSLAIYGPSISWKVLRVRNVDVYAGGRAKNYLRKRPKTITPADVERISRAADRVLASRASQA